MADALQKTAACKEFMLPLRETLEVLGGKWKIIILVELSFGISRFKEIQKAVTGITAKTLSKELKELELHQLISRKEYDTKPPKVEYELTPYGWSLEKVINEMRNWGIEHRKRHFGQLEMAVTAEQKASVEEQ